MTGGLRASALIPLGRPCGGPRSGRAAADGADAGAADDRLQPRRGQAERAALAHHDRCVAGGIPPRPAHPPPPCPCSDQEEEEDANAPASGPYTLEDSLAYEPFQDFMAEVDRQRPDVVILVRRAKAR